MKFMIGTETGHWTGTPKKFMSDTETGRWTGTPMKFVNMKRKTNVRQFLNGTIKGKDVFILQCMSHMQGCLVHWETNKFCQF